MRRKNIIFIGKKKAIYLLFFNNLQLFFTSSEVKIMSKTIFFNDFKNAVGIKL